MTSANGVVFGGSNLSLVWSAVFESAYRARAGKIGPYLVSINGFEGILPEEQSEIRTALDRTMCDFRQSNRRFRVPSPRATAMTIFPFDIWIRRRKPDHDAFRTFCETSYLPRLRALNSLNRYGTYFGRMIGYRGTELPNGTIDQLGFVIRLLRDSPKRPRSSGLQIACFDPAIDLTRQPVRGFPCLQQVGLCFTSDGALKLTAFYPTQYLFDRAYGNYLGLCHLGAYIAYQSNRRFAGLNCFIGQGDLGSVSKSRLRNLAAVVGSTSSNAVATPN